MRHKVIYDKRNKLRFKKIVLTFWGGIVGAKNPRALFFQARNEQGDYILRAKEMQKTKQALSKLKNDALKKFQ